MSKAAPISQSDTSELIEEMDTIISRRPEWRFLEQQRYLKDIIRLLLRDTESYAHHFTHIITNKRSCRQKALTSCWFSLLLSQELQHPPQFTRQAFAYTFYSTQAEDHQQDSMQKIIAKHILSSHITESGLGTLNSIATFCSEMQRLQRNDFCWDKPWYVIRPCLFFLNHITPIHWIKRISELMLLLEQHDSLLSQNSSSPQQSHNSAPLKEKVAEALLKKLKKYQDFANQIDTNQSKLNELLKRKSNKTPTIQEIATALQHMRDAWEKTTLLKTHQQLITEHTSILFHEAEHQRLMLAHTLKPAHQALLSSITTSQEQQLYHIIKSIFEV